MNPAGSVGCEILILGRSFMDGTFHEGGIQCEACHVAGARHAKFNVSVESDPDPRTLDELTADDAGYGQAIACGECHTRDGERDYPSYVSKFDQALIDNEVADTRPDEMGGRIAASGGLIKHHEQYDEIVGIDPDTLQSTRSFGFMATHGNCNTCHNPHGSSVNVDNTAYTGVAGVDKSSDFCLGCHTNYDPQLQGPGMQTLECAECHMPKLAKSATSVAGEGSRPAVGDVTSHIFRIALDSTQPQFTEGGSFAYPAIDEAWACRTCHNLTATAEAPFEVSDTFVDTYTFHTNIVD